LGIRAGILRETILIKRHVLVSICLQYCLFGPRFLKLFLTLFFSSIEWLRFSRLNVNSVTRLPSRVSIPALVLQKMLMRIQVVQHEIWLEDVSLVCAVHNLTRDGPCHVSKHSRLEDLFDYLVVTLSFEHGEGSVCRCSELVLGKYLLVAGISFGL